MRALYFMKVDYILTRKQFYTVPLFFAVALMVGRGMAAPEMSLLVACSYMLFVASIFTTAPFGFCAGKNRGFLLLFPATVRERVAGRFLYGLSFVTMLALLCGVFMGVYSLMGVEFPFWILAIGLWELAIGIALVALEFLFFYLFGEGKENWQYLGNIVRIAPGMALFFASNALIGELQDQAAAGSGMDLGVMTGKMMQTGIAAVAVSLLLTVVAAAVCVKVIEKRDYA